MVGDLDGMQTTQGINYQSAAPSWRCVRQNNDTRSCRPWHYHQHGQPGSAIAPPKLPTASQSATSGVAGTLFAMLAKALRHNAHRRERKNKQ